MKKFFSIIFGIIFILVMYSSSHSLTYVVTDPNKPLTFVYNHDNPEEQDVDLFRLYQSITPGLYVTGPGNGVGENNNVSVLFDEDPDNDYEALEITLDPRPEGIFYYVATASNTSGNESDKSNEVHLIVDYTPPPSPTGLNVPTPIITDSNLSPTIQWTFNNPPSDFGGYRVYKTLTSGNYQFGPDHDIVEIKDVGTITTNVGLLLEGSTYFVVTAFDKVGNESLPSNEIVIVANYSPPDPPSGLKCLGLDVYIEF